MNPAKLPERLRELAAESVPLPGQGRTAERHRRLFQIAQEDVSLAKLVEAHWDAVAILAEAGRQPEAGAVYGVWASEIPGEPLCLGENRLSGTKAFCSGFGLVDRALVTLGAGDGRLLDVDLRQPTAVTADLSAWQPEAFRATNTGAVTFREAVVSPQAVVGTPGFYLERPGFWHGACGPAACWAGGAAGLLTFARNSKRADAHTLAHLAALEASCWGMQTLLEEAGRAIDRAPGDSVEGQRRALMLRFLIEGIASDMLRRFGRAYGPYPLAMDPQISRRYAETEILLRQSHAERDLEALARIDRKEQA